MFSHTSGRSSLGLSTLPRSPPVQVTTSTSTPSLTYLAIAAAPLLDSSSGCACTAISRSCSATSSPPLDPRDVPYSERYLRQEIARTASRDRDTRHTQHRTGVPTRPLRAPPGADATASTLGDRHRRGRCGGRGAGHLDQTVSAI